MPRLCRSSCPLRPNAAIEEEYDEPLQLDEEEPIDLSVAVKELYQPIHPWQTRIVVLKHGSLGSELQADLEVIDLIYAEGAVLHEKQEKIDYTALSYTWDVDGQSRDPQSNEVTIIDRDKYGAMQHMTLNGVKFPIAPSLYCFLQRYREQMSARHIWIDALCINQHDNGERARQVANMLTIFKKAYRVLVWLGEAGPYTHLALRYLDWCKGEDIRHFKSCKPRQVQLIQGLSDLYSRPWIARIWIRQEVWAAHRLRVLCGTAWCGWTGFGGGLNAIDTASLDDPGSGNATSVTVGHYATMLEYLSRREKNELAEPEVDGPIAPLIGHRDNDHDLVTLLNRTLNCRMTDERDRIYAQLGMTMIKPRIEPRTEATKDRLDLVIDYSRPLSLVFQDLARYIMKRERSVASILCLQATFGSQLFDDKLPSWAIDWRYQTSCQPYLYFEKQLRGKTFSCEQEVHSRQKTGNGALKPTTSRKSGQDSDTSDNEKSNDSSHEDVESHVHNWHMNETRLIVPNRRKSQALEQYLDREFSAINRSESHDKLYTYDSKVTTVPWSGPIQDESPVLQLRGYMLGTLTERLPWELPSWTFHLRYKTKKDPTPRFEKDSDLAERVQKYLNDASPDRLKNLRADLQALKKCVFRIPGGKVVLHPNDVDVVRAKREIVPVSDSDHFRRWQQKELWGDIKFMSLEPAKSVQVKLSETKKSHLFQRYTKTNEERRKRKTQNSDGDTDAEVWATDEEEDLGENSDTSDDDEDLDDADISGLSDSDEDSDDSSLQSPVTVLNETFNSHFPSEFAVPEKAQRLDQVVVVEGSALPLVLRPTGTGRQFTYMGPALLDNQLHAPSQKKQRVKFDLSTSYRLQLSAYEHFQLLFRKRLRRGTSDTFDII